MQLPFFAPTGIVVRRQGDSYEVLTESGIRCLVSQDCDSDGGNFVDVPPAWHHTDAEYHEVVGQAREALLAWWVAIRREQVRRELERGEAYRLEA